MRHIFETSRDAFCETRAPGFIDFRATRGCDRIGCGPAWAAHRPVALGAPAYARIGHHAPRLSLRHSFRTDQDRSRDREESFLPGAPLQRHGPCPAAEP